MKNTRMMTFAALLGLFFTVLHAQDPWTEAMKKNYEEELRAGIINIVGQVTDENGKPLDDVKLSITFTRPKNMLGTESERHNESIRVNGNFSIKRERYTSVRISFLKDGYHTLSLILYTGEPINAPGAAIQTAFKAKLREIGKEANLVEYNSALKYNIKDQTKNVCDLSNFPTESLRSKVFGLNADIKLKRYIYIDFERDDKGEIILGKKVAAGTQAFPAQTYILRLVSPDPEDGFIALTGAPIVDLTYLNEAPASGYLTKELRVPYSPDAKLYFYIKCNRFYGKGRLSHLNARKDEFRHEFGMRTKMQLNKEQNDCNLRSED